MRPINEIKKLTEKNMPYVANNPKHWIGHSVGSGQCVAYVQKASGEPRTVSWQRGELVRGNNSIVSGTAIATFDQNGTYGNHTDGRSHAAIYVRQDANSITVLDQWSGHHVSERKIHFHDAPRSENDGRNYYVVE
jgi:hypothetical protein